MNDKKITGDILTFKKAFDICSDLMSKALVAQDHAGATALAKAMRLFHEAMENSDEEMDGLREETEGFKSSESAAAFNRSLQRDAKHWGKDEEDRPRFYPRPDDPSEVDENVIVDLYEPEFGSEE